MFVRRLFVLLHIFLFCSLLAETKVTDSDYPLFLYIHTYIYAPTLGTYLLLPNIWYLIVTDNQPIYLLI